MRAWHRSLPSLGLEPVSVWPPPDDPVRAANQPSVAPPEPSAPEPAGCTASEVCTVIEPEESPSAGFDPAPLLHALERVELAVAGAARLDARVVVDLSLEIAKAVIEQTLDVSPDALRSLVESVLRSATREECVTVRLAPRHVETLSSLEDPMLSGVTLSPDPSLGPADVVVNLATGGLDARVSARWERLRPALVDFFRQDEKRTAG